MRNIDIYAKWNEFDLKMKDIQQNRRIILNKYPIIIIYDKLDACKNYWYDINADEYYNILFYCDIEAKIGGLDFQMLIKNCEILVIARLLLKNFNANFFFLKRI